MVADSDASALFSAAFTSTGRGHISVITDGPYLETKEHIGGFWVLEAVDLDEALEGAQGRRRLSGARRGASVSLKKRPAENGVANVWAIL